MSEPIVYGDPISTYDSLMAVDLIKGQHKQPEHMARNPWGKMPAFEHAGLRF